MDQLNTNKTGSKFTRWIETLYRLCAKFNEKTKSGDAPFTDHKRDYSQADLAHLEAKYGYHQNFLRWL